MNRLDEIKGTLHHALDHGLMDDDGEVYGEHVQYLVSRLEIAEKALTYAEWPAVGILECSYCRNDKTEGHKDDCLIGKAVQQINE